MSPATLEILYNLLFSSIDSVSIESLLELYGVKKSNIAKFHSLGPKTISNLQTEEKTHDFLKAFLLNKMAEHTKEKRQAKLGNIVATLALAVISNAHAIGKVACCVVNDADLDSISKLLSTVALELSNTIRKIKPKILEFDGKFEEDRKKTMDTME